MNLLSTEVTTTVAAEQQPRRLPFRARAFRLLRTLSHPLYWWYQKKLVARVLAGRVPDHIGLILDGNRRFARGIGLDVRQGHEFGVEKVHEL
ncbi:MAG TPA: isoprenyl transferase, partial [Gammaproteobacteria bacterium]|nr:isoprenyl transferase [Gammaproteobacteria bacterium]